MTGLLILGDQLFSPEILENRFPERPRVLMVEDEGLCTHFRYHQQKLVFFLSAMRHYCRELESHGWTVDYRVLDSGDASYLEVLGGWLKSHSIRTLQGFEVSDRFFENSLEAFAQAQGVAWRPSANPGFLTSRAEFRRYLESVKKPFMKTFYESQRTRLQVLIERDGSPTGGRWSFDEENRERLPKDLLLPLLPSVSFSEEPEREEVIRLVERRFGSHPGRARASWLPTTRDGARLWLSRFIQERLEHFGPYEDAISSRGPVLFHSVLTPFLNSGLLTPHEVIRTILDAYRKKRLPLNSVEGFVRQVIGWREFVYGIDRNFHERQWNTNHWGHHRRLTEHWYLGTTGLAPLDDAIRKANDLAYAHHIERLMVLGNAMVLCEIHPHEAYRWFMEMFVDSADWVMGPNVFGMGIFSDGGVFATKPYLCGSNYWLKMSDYSKGPWCDVIDGLYWSFLKRHQKALLKNPRMATMARAVDKLEAGRRERIFKAADDFKARVTYEAPEADD